MATTKKLSLILLIAAIAVVLWYAISLLKNQVQPGNNKPAEVINNATSTEQNAQATSTKDWLTYKNEEYGFEVKYPGKWTITNKSFSFEGLITMISPETLKNIKEAIARNKATEIPGGDIIISVINKNNEKVDLTTYLANNTGPGNIINYNQTSFNNYAAYEALLGGFGSYYALYLEHNNIIYRILFELKDKKENLSTAEKDILNSFRFIN